MSAGARPASSAVPAHARVGGDGGLRRQRVRLGSDGGVRGVDADPGEVADGVFNVLPRAHQGELFAPRQDPAEVGGEAGAAAVFEADTALEVAAGERHAAPQVNHPFAVRPGAG